MTAAIEGPAEWIAVIVLLPILLVFGVLLLWEIRRPPIEKADLNWQQAMCRLTIEGQLLALGVPADQVADEARLIFEHHRAAPISEASLRAIHDDIVSIAGGHA